MTRQQIAAALGLTLVGALAGALITLAARSPAPASAPAAPEVRADGDAPSPRLSAAGLERVGIRFAPVTRATASGAIDVVGMLELNREHLAEVSMHAAGRVARIHAHVGRQVRRGEVLALVESPAIGQAAAEYLVKQAELRTARQHLTRQTELRAQQLTTSREFELAESEVRSAQAETDAALTRLTALGVSPRSVNPRTGHAPLVAPIDGVVIQRDILLGSWLEPGTDAFTIADLSTLWAQLDVFEGDLGAMSVGDPVSIDVAALGLRDVPGEVQFIHAELDRATRMGRVRIVVQNPEGRLRAGLSVAAHVRPRGTGAALRVPVESVRERDGTPHVLVRRGEELTWQTVETGPRRNGEVEIVRGLEEGDVIAISGLGLLSGAI
jgi:cobalt-zinc-cadmium efflux system membrane fusion protein